ncbi:MAG TPA: hypothetical protein VF752_08080, partial [Thermoleophilaceae bacterium]
MQQLQTKTETGGTSALLSRFAGTDTGRAAGMAAAMIATNVIALAFTIVFARLLGASGYGSLAALVSTFLILAVPGSAVQIQVAREIGRELAQGRDAPAAAVRHWTERLLVATAAAAVVGVLLREPLASLIGVEEVPWAAAATLPSAALWVVVCVQRGALQAFQRYRLVGSSLVGEASGRLAIGVILEAIGLGVTGAFLGTAASLAVVALVLGAELRRQLADANSQRAFDPGARLRKLLRRAEVPLLALAMIAVLQNIDLIVVKHNANGDPAGSYAAAAVAAKVPIWVAIGLGMYLLPEAARRVSVGMDARPVLARTLAVIAAIALPMVLFYTVAGEPLLRTVFGDDLTLASDALPLLGLAMSLLAATFLAVQYLLALHRQRFLWLLAAAAALDPVLVNAMGSNLTDVALVLMCLQAALAAAMLVTAVRAKTDERP